MVFRLAPPPSSCCSAHSLVVALGRTLASTALLEQVAAQLELLGCYLRRSLLLDAVLATVPRSAIPAIDRLGLLREPLPNGETRGLGVAPGQFEKLI
jgi:hypothetical protein